MRGAPPVALGACTLLIALSLTGCGDYDPEPRAAAGGGAPAMATGTLDAAGQTTGDGAAGAAPASMGGAAGSGAPASGAGSASLGGASGAGGAGIDATPVEVAPVEADCEAVGPCGGDVVGTWVVAGSCLPISGMANMSGFGLGCTEAPVTGALEVTGTWSASADGTFTDGTRTTGSSQIELPASCLNVSGTSTTCDRLGGALQALGYSSVECADAASGGCTCAATVDQTGGLGVVAFGAASSGTYTTDSALLTASAGSANTYAYCVAGNQMVMTPQATGTTGAVTGTIVFVQP